MKTKFIRKNKSIIEIDTDNKIDLKTDFKSINLAKKESHKLQMKLDGGLGRGSVKIG